MNPKKSLIFALLERLRKIAPELNHNEALLEVKYGFMPPIQREIDRQIDRQRAQLQNEKEKV